MSSWGTISFSQRAVLYGIGHVMLVLLAMSWFSLGTVKTPPRTVLCCTKLHSGRTWTQCGIFRCTNRLCTLAVITTCHPPLHNGYGQCDDHTVDSNSEHAKRYYQPCWGRVRGVLGRFLNGQIVLNGDVLLNWTGNPQDCRTAVSHFGLFPSETSGTLSTYCHSHSAKDCLKHVHNIRCTNDKISTAEH